MPSMTVVLVLIVSIGTVALVVMLMFLLTRGKKGDIIYRNSHLHRKHNKVKTKAIESRLLELSGRAELSDSEAEEMLELQEVLNGKPKRD